MVHGVWHGRSYTAIPSAKTCRLRPVPFKLPFSALSERLLQHPGVPGESDLQRGGWNRVRRCCRHTSESQTQAGGGVTGAPSSLPRGPAKSTEPTKELQKLPEWPPHWMEGKTPTPAWMGRAEAHARPGPRPQHHRPWGEPPAPSSPLSQQHAGLRDPQDHRTQSSFLPCLPRLPCLLPPAGSTDETEQPGAPRRGHTLLWLDRHSWDRPRVSRPRQPSDLAPAKPQDCSKGRTSSQWS